MNRNTFVRWARATFGERYDYSRVPGKVRAVVEVGCPVHGWFRVRSEEHWKGEGCKKCKVLDDFVGKAKAVHGDRYDYSHVADSTPPQMIIICRQHGVFEQNKYSHIKGRGCPICNPAFNRPSRIASAWLDSLGVPNDSEHREVGGLVPGRRFRVDGYDPKTRTVYEFYGDSTHGNPALYEPQMVYFSGLTMGELNKKRLEKEALIKEAGYNLVTIWERDFKYPYGLPPKSTCRDQEEVTLYLDDFIDANNLRIDP